MVICMLSLQGLWIAFSNIPNQHPQNNNVIILGGIVKSIEIYISIFGNVLKSTLSTLMQGLGNKIKNMTIFFTKYFDINIVTIL